MVKEITKRYKMVMFDMDGTLIDSFYFHAKCFQRFLARYGVDLTKEQTAGMMGNTIQTILSNTLPEEMHETALGEMSAFYISDIDDLIDEMQVVRGSIYTVKRIKSMGYFVTILTNSKKEVVEKISDKKGFTETFDMIEGADSDSLNKELRCKKVLNRFNVLPEEVLYVGDSPYDVKLARSVGMKSCLIDNDISWLQHESFSGEYLEPDYIKSDITQILELI